MNFINFIKKYLKLKLECLRCRKNSKNATKKFKRLNNSLCEAGRVISDFREVCIEKQVKEEAEYQLVKTENGKLEFKKIGGNSK